MCGLTLETSPLPSPPHFGPAVSAFWSPQFHYLRALRFRNQHFTRMARIIRSRSSVMADLLVGGRKNQTEFPFSLSSATNVSALIVDASGREVRQLLDGSLPIGTIASLGTPPTIEAGASGGHLLLVRAGAGMIVAASSSGRFLPCS